MPSGNCHVSWRVAGGDGGTAVGGLAVLVRPRHGRDRGGAVSGEMIYEGKMGHYFVYIYLWSAMCVVLKKKEGMHAAAGVNIYLLVFFF